MSPTFILPGLNGSPEGHWQRHWARERTNASVIEQEDWSCPILEDWQAELDRALLAVDGAFLVAHSLGCLLAASYAGRSIAGKIRGALLVAPCSLQMTRRLHPCMIEFGEERLAPLPFPSLVIGSLNDPYMSVPDLERHVNAWGSDLATIGFAGHINIASGFGRWTEGYSFFERLNNGRSDARASDRSISAA
ncbi:putative alpha/beta hydrolase family esterase [Neorhizobium sp. 2083]|uniref:RBBP9/YdeN family alpha/beta hydrolase n=1 Tax=Neorhizobium sp. 2083 TaxID=2817762 RepID=UPI0028614A91|nr:alpha/beta fold hydrolase [Neorhizobium sp. 2083]MDR6819765.1 putative alpha/beta hydrolase family esterase [Neorhizobium sp. 2083]